jgi:hypothetical protein
MISPEKHDKTVRKNALSVNQKREGIAFDLGVFFVYDTVLFFSECAALFAGMTWSWWNGGSRS